MTTIEKSLRTAIEQAPLFDAEKLWEEPIVMEESSTVDFLQAKKKRISRGKIYSLATAACMVLAFTGWLYTFRLSDSVVSIDVNPSIQLTTNRCDRVLEVCTKNDDAKELIKDLELEKKDIHKAVDMLMEELIEEEYLQEEEENVVLVFVGNKKENHAKQLTESLETKIDEKFSQKNLTGKVIKYSGKIDKNLENEAEKYGMSLGKMRYIQQILDNEKAQKEYTVEDLAQKNIKALEEVEQTTKKHSSDKKEDVQTEDENSTESENKSTSKTEPVLKQEIKKAPQEAGSEDKTVKPSNNQNNGTTQNSDVQTGTTHDEKNPTGGNGQNASANSTEKQTTQNENATKQPTADKVENTNKPTNQETDTTKKPESQETDNTKKPTNQVTDTTKKPTNQVTDTTKKPTNPVTDTTKKPTNQVTDTTKKPTNQVTDTTKKPTNPVTDTTKKPTNQVTDTTKKPTNQVTDTTKKPTNPVTDNTKKPINQMTDNIKNTTTQDGNNNNKPEDGAQESNWMQNRKNEGKSDNDKEEVDDGKDDVTKFFEKK